MSTQTISRGEALVREIPLNYAIEQSSLRDIASIEETISLGTSATDSANAAETSAANSQALLETMPLESEKAFYEDYSWCLNPFPTLQEAAAHLRAELAKVSGTAGWQYSEVVTNIFLLSCAITDTVDDFLLGTIFDFSKLARALPITSPGVRLVQSLLDWRSRMRFMMLSRLRNWRNEWAEAVTDFIQYAMVSDSGRPAIVKQRDRLAALLPRRFDEDLGSRRPKIPAFSVREILHFPIV